jgi:hypothetical protein
MSKRILKEELPSNSKSSRVVPIRPESKIQEEGALIPDKPARKAVRGNAIIKKKTITQSIAKSLISEQTSGVAQYILYDVLIPAAKNLLNDMVTSGIEMLLFGETKSGRRSKDRDKGRSIVSYGSYYKGRDRDDDRRESRRPSRRDKFDLSDIYFRHHDEAEEVLDELCERLEEFDQVSVADYFELAGIDGATWAHDKYGWDDLSKAYNTHTRNGWAIVLPDPIPLD